MDLFRFGSWRKPCQALLGISTHVMHKAQPPCDATERMGMGHWGDQVP